MSRYFEKTHTEIEFEETTCAECGGTWFWSLQQVKCFVITPDDEDAAVIKCPYCYCDHLFVL